MKNRGILLLVKLILFFSILTIQKDMFAQIAGVNSSINIGVVQVETNDGDLAFAYDMQRGFYRGDTQGIPPDTLHFNFDNFDNWRYRHQDTATVKQYRLSEGMLFLSTRAQTYDRTKVDLLATKLTTGRSSCRVFIPTMYPFDQTSIASFLYCDDRHEIDFEIGYGSAKKRAELNTQNDEVLCYMTSQANPFQSEMINLKMNRWYVIDLDITLKNGKYFTQWFIDGELKASLKQEFGKEIKYKAVLSLENLKFMGDHIPKHNYEVKFDWLDIIHYRE